MVVAIGRVCWVTLVWLGPVDVTRTLALAPAPARATARRAREVLVHTPGCAQRAAPGLEPSHWPQHPRVRPHGARTRGCFTPLGAPSALPRASSLGTGPSTRTCDRTARAQGAGSHPWVRPAPSPETGPLALAPSPARATARRAREVLVHTSSCAQHGPPSLGPWGQKSRSRLRLPASLATRGAPGLCSGSG